MNSTNIILYHIRERDVAAFGVAPDPRERESRVSRRKKGGDAGVCEQHIVLLRRPFPCSPAAETAIQPLIWGSESLCSNVCTSPQECFFHRQGLHEWGERSPSMQEPRHLHKALAVPHAQTTRQL